MRRQIKVSTLKFVLENEYMKHNLKGESIRSFFSWLKKLPINLKQKHASRYSESETGNEHAVIFSDEIKDLSIQYRNVLIGVFLKRRGNNRPWEDDGEGHLIELTLSNEAHEIAEVSYFGIDIDSGILFWTYNPLVGGINQFVSYLNRKMNLLRSSELLEEIQEGYTDSKQLGLYYIGYPDSVSLFEKKMEQIQRLEFHLAGDADFLSEAFLFNNDERDRKGMRLLREFAKQSNCASISINLSAEKSKTINVGKNKKEKKVFSLNKQFILNLFYETAEHLKAKRDSRFNVQGEVIDEETRVLDLVHSRLCYPLMIDLNEEEDVFIQSITAFYSLIISKIDEARKYYDNEVE
jgi:hypothetical protein